MTGNFNIEPLGYFYMFLVCSGISSGIYTIITSEVAVAMQAVVFLCFAIQVTSTCSSIEKVYVNLNVCPLGLLPLKPGVGIRQVPYHQLKQTGISHADQLRTQCVCAKQRPKMLWQQNRPKVAANLCAPYQVLVRNVLLDRRFHHYFPADLLLLLPRNGRRAAVKLAFRR